MSIPPLWVIQKNLGSSPDVAALRDACADLGLPSQEIAVVPFTNALPEVPADRPAIFYGSARLVDLVSRSGRWNPGVFFEEERFRYSVALERYGGEMLNASARVTTMGALADSPLPDGERLFLRPDRDPKEFPGEVTTLGEFRAWCERLRPGGFEIGLNTPIIAAPPVPISREWRLFLVRGRVSSGSRYRERGRPDPLPSVPEEVLAYGQWLAGIWSPAEVFVMDIAESGGRLRLLEINGFNSAGFYAAEVRKIVRDVSEAVNAPPDS
ncbi:MAG: ATP-grasp domain-containing protein [Armatimonadetes bacterium]|nr:ATP-grasp domain-containing protein [Armatimonadota bacterium]